ncbi:ABC transporter substrate-binding protein [Haloarculaceae archaeon H-GB2-1]|nr:ABC transporter substrate-binding protein [Haloarculaceae archaeon H-GB1-1]MEA5386336.1 ABC transporter substrate-binding protein [Haloarculaceae archaeon H-GB11]MEA5407839.1 ABC transporter substrate-binding protein [Haloarculaceae archaeon H-GB2-1]
MSGTATGTDASTTLADDQDLTVAVERDPTRGKWDVYGGITPYYTQVLEPLVGVNQEMETTPALATNWEALDEQTWRFDLREGVTFHNGAALTADAVAASFESILNYWSWASGWIRLQPEGITVVDDHTIEFENTEPFPAFPGTISHNYWAVWHPDADTDAGEVVGTGPFRVESITEGRRATLVPFEDYRGETARPSSLTFRFIEDPNTRSLALQKGEVDVAYKPPRSTASELSSGEATAIETQLSTEAKLGAVNLYKSPTDDETLRRALNYAVDQASIVENVLGGIGKPARGPFSSAIPWAVHDELPEYGPDREKATQLVSESAYDGEELTILVNSSKTDDKTTAEILQQWFAEIGVESTIRQVEGASFYDTFTAGEAHVSLVDFGSNSAAADYVIRAMFHSQGSDNRKLYESEGTGIYNPGPEVDDLIEKGYAATDLETKTEHYGEVQRRVVETGAVVPLFYSEYVLGKRASVQGLGTHPIDKMVSWTDFRRTT